MDTEDGRPELGKRRGGGGDAKVAPAKGTLRHPWKQEDWSRGIASWGADSSAGSDSGSLCDLGRVAAPLWVWVGSVEGCGGGVCVCREGGGLDVLWGLFLPHGGARSCPLALDPGPRRPLTWRQGAGAAGALCPGGCGLRVLGAPGRGREDVEL